MKSSMLILVLLMFASCGKQSSGRYIGGAGKLEAPKDCVKILSIAKSKSSKYITYVNSKGVVYMKAYSDHGIFEGSYIVTGHVQLQDVPKEATNEK